MEKYRWDDELVKHMAEKFQIDLAKTKSFSVHVEAGHDVRVVCEYYPEKKAE